MGYVNVSDAIMRDMLSAKSKLTEIEEYVSDNAENLKLVGVYYDLMRIINRAGYSE